MGVLKSTPPEPNTQEANKQIQGSSYKTPGTGVKKEALTERWEREKGRLLITYDQETVKDLGGGNCLAGP